MSEAASARAVKQTNPNRTNLLCVFMTAAVLLLFEPDIFAEVVPLRIVAFVLAKDSFLVPITVETSFEKPDHYIPGILRRFFSVAAGHGVVEPTVRRVGINTNVAILFRFL